MQNRKEKFVSNELPIPIDDIRLVVKMQDDRTGAISDVIVKHLRGGKPYTERPHGSTLPSHTRYIVGLEMEIPWPEDELNEFSAEPSDTLRQQVEEATYIPTLIDNAIPEGVEDELRGKFTRGRGRHDFEWMRKKLEEDARATWEKSRKLLTPGEEYQEMVMKKKRAEGPPVVSEETLDIIRKMQAASLNSKHPADISARW
jgi:large subunit ribosomal protein L24